MALAFLVSCSSHENHSPNTTNTKTEYFLDVNLFNLSGINKINNIPDYPYVEIQSPNDTTRTIIFYATKDISYTHKYKKLSNYWMRSFRFYGDTAWLTEFEYVYPDKILSLTFSITDRNEPYMLTTATVLESSHETTYMFEKGISVSPSPDVIKVIRNRISDSTLRKIQFMNGIMSIDENQIIDGKATLQKECYTIGDHSYFWWLYFGLGKEVSCN
ncbi:MAG: hypothetical protein EPN92_05260 [Chitinophagaceae bacterium]|nr:MAG: hypothetical protein EPN92_05260 [Chitinophagaceae bacterium]